jgi:hypothetical protein
MTNSVVDDGLYTIEIGVELKEEAQKKKKDAKR